MPDDEPALLKLFGVAHPDAVGESLQEAIQYPSLNIRGMHSGYDDRTIIPPDATAAIDIRLVKETPSAHMLQLVRAHIEKQGYHIVDGEPTDADACALCRSWRVYGRRGRMEAFRTEPDSPDARRSDARAGSACGARRRYSSGPWEAPSHRRLHSRIERAGGVGVPIVNFDNNQHGDNENLRLGNLWSGIVSLAAMLEM